MSTMRATPRLFQPPHDRPLRFERRCLDRWPIQGSATAICVAGECFGRMHELSLIDCSHDGLGARSSQPMTPGMLVAVGFQTPGRPAKRGVVLRCQPCGEGYRVAIQFQVRLAA